jgi:hypothetical protein
MRQALAVVVLLCTVVMADPSRTTVRPVDNGAVLENPSMGWVFHHFDNSIHQYGPPLGPSYAGEGWPGLTVAYLRLAWSYLEPEDGVFDWSLVDDVAERYIRAGRKIAFRFTCFESAIPYATPKWLADAGVPGRWFRYGVGVVDGPEVERATWEPRYDHPLFLEKLDRFLAAAARRYDGNPNVAFIDIGSIGIWGEGNPCSRKYPLSMYKTHIELHARHFKNTLLVGMDDWRPRPNLHGRGPHAGAFLIRPDRSLHGRTLHVRVGLWLYGRQGRHLPHGRFLPTRGMRDRRVEVGTLTVGNSGQMNFRATRQNAEAHPAADFAVSATDFQARDGYGILGVNWTVLRELPEDVQEFCHVGDAQRDIRQNCRAGRDRSEALDYARERGATMRDDSIIYRRGFRFDSDRLAEDFWRERPVVLESGHYGVHNWADGADRDYLAAIEAYHGSYVSIHGPPDEIMARHADVVREMSLRMGYRLQLVEASWPAKVAAGRRLSVRCSWRNAGVAPCYPGGYAAVTLKRAGGTVGAVLVDSDFNLRNLGVGPVGKAPVVEREVVARLPEGLREGDYDLSVSVGKRDGTPVIALPLAGGDGERRYRRGRIAVRSVPRDGSAQPRPPDV